MAEIVWVGPGWYKLLTFAVGNKKLVQVSQNKEADLDPACVWLESFEQASKQFIQKPVTVFKRITY